MKGLIRTFTRKRSKIPLSQSLRWFFSHPSAVVENAIPRQTVQLSRLMSPEEANIRGFIHGGSLIRSMEEAGFVAATRQIAHGSPGANAVRLGALVRIEQLDFRAPVEVGDVVEIKGGVDFVSSRSCRISLQVTAASVVQPEKRERGKRLTNEAKLWYVPLIVGSDGRSSVMSMPRVDLSDVEDAELESAHGDYLAHKARRAEIRVNSSGDDVDLLLSQTRPREGKPGSVEWTRSATSFLVDHNDCDVAGNTCGGTILKMADEVAGLAASKHSMGGTPTTVRMDAVDFNEVIPRGSFVRLESHVTFVGRKSCEVTVRGDAVHLYAEGGPVAIPNAMEARFTFVAYDATGRLKPMPPLEPKTPKERKEFEEARGRNETRKKERLKLETN